MPEFAGRHLPPRAVRHEHSAPSISASDALKKGMEERSLGATLAQLNETAFYLNSENYRNFAMKRIAE
jgi:hypothetical protein